MEVIPEDAVVVLTRGGLVRRYAPRTYEKLELPDSEAEFQQVTYRTATDHTLLFFTDLGNCFRLSVGALNEITRVKERGVSLQGLLQGLEKDEKSVAMLDLPPQGAAGLPDLVFVTKNGLVKRTAAGEYDLRRGRFAACSLKGDDRVLSVFHAEADDDLLLVTKIPFLMVDCLMMFSLT